MLRGHSLRGCMQPVLLVVLKTVLARPVRFKMPPSSWAKDRRARSKTASYLRQRTKTAKQTDRQCGGLGGRQPREANQETLPATTATAAAAASVQYWV